MNRNHLTSFLVISAFFFRVSSRSAQLAWLRPDVGRSLCSHQPTQRADLSWACYYAPPAHAVEHAQNPLVLQTRRRVLPSLFFLFLSPARRWPWLTCRAANVPPVCLALLHSQIEKVFKLFDEDNTGYITFRNLKKICNDLGENLYDTLAHADTRCLTDDAALPCVYPLPMQPSHAHSLPAPRCSVLLFFFDVFFF